MAILLLPGGDGGKDDDTVPPGTQLAKPLGLALMTDGSVLVADGDNHQVVRVSKDRSSEVFAGTGEAGDGTLVLAEEDRVVGISPGADARPLVKNGAVGLVAGLAVHPDGWRAVSDNESQVVVRVLPDGTVRPIAGRADGAADPRTDGHPALDTAISEPSGIAFDQDGRLLFSETGNSRVRRVETDGTVRTLAGSPEGYASGDSGDDGPSREAEFVLLAGPLTVDGDTIYIGDEGNGRVRRLDADGLGHAFAD